MPIPADTTLMTFGGYLPGGEVWQCGIWGSGHTPDDNGSANGLAEIYYDELTATDGSGGIYEWLQLFAPNTVAIRQTRVYCYPTGGPRATFIGQYTGAPVLGTNAQELPNQVSAVLTLHSDFAGRQNRGRIYLPCLKGSLDAAGNLNNGNLATTADAWKSFFDDWNAADVPTLSVVSRTGSHVHPITSLSIDSRPDIQRRRANKQTIESNQTRELLPV